METAQHMFASEQDVIDFTGFSQREKQLSYLREKKIKVHVNGKGELKVPTIELIRVLGLNQDKKSKLNMEWTREKSPVSRRTQN